MKKKSNALIAHITKNFVHFVDRFGRFDTIPAVTASHPDIHVAVASTR